MLDKEFISVSKIKFFKKDMINKLKTVLASTLLVFASIANAQTTDLVDVAMGSKDHTTLVTAFIGA